MKIRNTEIKIVQGDIAALKVGTIVNATAIGLEVNTDEVKIRAAVRSALKTAEKMKIESIAFPALGCGTGGFSYLACAKIMAQEVLRHVKYKESGLREIIFCLFDQEAFEIFNKGVISYLEYVIHKLQNGPFTTTDAIIDIPASPALGFAERRAGGDGGVVVIKRSNPPFGWALPGGFVDYGESLEDAVRREMKEETGLELLDLKQFHTYSDPGRDPRFHTICTVFTAKAKGKPRAGDDAADLKIVQLKDIESMDFAFDHKKILQDYIKSKK